MDIAGPATSLNLVLIVTGVTGVLALIGSLAGGVMGFRSVWGWILGSSAFLLPLLVGAIGSVVVLLQVTSGLDAMDPVLADQIIMEQFTLSMYPLGLGTILTVVCVVAFFIAGIISGAIRKRRQGAAEGS